MTPKDSASVEELRKLREAATPDEWEARGAAIITKTSDLAYLYDNDGEDLLDGIPNAEFIAYAANQLVGIIDELQLRREETIAMCAQLREQIDAQARELGELRAELARRQAQGGQDAQ